MKHLFIIVLFLMELLVPGGQDKQPVYPKNYFRSPVDFPITLAGGFGDIRRITFIRA